MSCRSITAHNSRRSCTPPWRLASRRWSSARWPGLTQPDVFLGRRLPLEYVVWKHATPWRLTYRICPSATSCFRLDTLAFAGGAVMIPLETFVHILDLGGTFVFAISGAVAA